MFAARIALLAVVCAGVAGAHVGSPDVFFQGQAGPYKVLVAIRPPDVIPGVAQVEIRALTAGVDKVEVTPMPMTGEASKHPPMADVAGRSSVDPNFYEGSLWLMGFGSWKVKVRVTGRAGAGEMQVPVPALAYKTKPMETGVEYFLFGMMVFLTVGMVAIAGSAVREAELEPGAAGAGWGLRPVLTMLGLSVLLVLVLWKGKTWWGYEAADHAEQIYKPLTLNATLQGDSQLQLQLQDPGWFASRKLDDLATDHGHLMHLFLLRWPAMDRVYHLHPEQTAAGYFATDLPAIPAGTYRAYGDIVHENGLAETAVGNVTLPDVTGRPPGPDDAAGRAGAEPTAGASFNLDNGYKMVWKREAAGTFATRRVRMFTFALEGPDGKPAGGMEPYMGMGGHAEFVGADGTVFAHVHPTGSVSMASVKVASNEEMLRMHESVVGNEVSFPYGLPKVGRYRVFVQMKHAGKVETGAFDLEAK